ncbi:questin oxidase family protein [Streptomyces hesseae]|uniref:Questin oxidase family protein n=1 Tax=Streptomyces hesseae TaxID=3075519 RepID=A0ABU2SLM0_9ACTN|nr:questin oxidase family protein [Streptomyces sp. DSM 40473]MDT0448769.1 questin oxidase family protein [Streptomyces sp. DSM 40473]
MTAITEDGTLDEALERVHSTGPEFQGWLSNHAPMTVEALARHGQARAVHRWLDSYRHRTEDLPTAALTITDANWHEALGDARHLGSWIAHFTRLTAELPWADVLTTWWPRLLPGIIAGATHPVIRVGHAVRTLLTDGETAPRTAELAHALGYWAARHQPLPGTVTPSGTAGPHRALDAIPVYAAVQEGGIRDRLARLPAADGWPAAASGLRRPAGPDDAHDLLAELVRATVARYPRYAHGDAVMLVHAATAPNAVLRVLPALPRALWVPSLAAAWEASAVITAAYAPARALFAGAGAGAAATMEESFALAAAHGDAHVIKLADTAWDVGGPAALAATARACELIEPGDG